jgi:hypothetical protein
MQPNSALDQESDRINQMRSSLHKERLATFAPLTGQTGQNAAPLPSGGGVAGMMSSARTPSTDRSFMNRTSATSATTPNGSLVERSKDLFSTARVVLTQDAFDGFLATIRALNDKKLGQAEALERWVQLVCTSWRQLPFFFRCCVHSHSFSAPRSLLLLLYEQS